MKVESQYFDLLKNIEKFSFFKISQESKAFRPYKRIVNSH